MKIVMIASTVIRVCFVICVTILSIRFNRIDLLWLFVLTPFLGYEYRRNIADHQTEKGGAE